MSAGTIPICGATLLVPVGSSSELMEGTWQSFTTKNINITPSFTRDRVVLSQSREIVEGYWPELK